MKSLERRARRSLKVLKLAALLVASAAAVAATGATATATTSSDTLVSSSPWWEKVTVTIGDDGKPSSCLYQSSLKSSGDQDCDVASTQASMASSDSQTKGEITRITFERRFDPGAAPTKTDLQTGDTLLGGQIMALAIDTRGAVKGCKVVGQSGAMRPDYSCDDAQAEKFQASVAGANATHEGYMTILVYGHSEHMV
jgi:hypothetical protein